MLMHQVSEVAGGDVRWAEATDLKPGEALLPAVAEGLVKF